MSTTLYFAYTAHISPARLTEVIPEAAFTSVEPSNHKRGTFMLFVGTFFIVARLQGQS